MPGWWEREMGPSRRDGLAGPPHEPERAMNPASCQRVRVDLGAESTRPHRRPGALAAGPPGAADHRVMLWRGDALQTWTGRKPAAEPPRLLPVPDTAGRGSAPDPESQFVGDLRWMERGVGGGGDSERGTDSCRGNHSVPAWTVVMSVHPAAA